MKIHKMIVMLPVVALSACGLSERVLNTPFGAKSQYTPPESSGLNAVRPYPAENDICQVIGENDLTAQYLDDSATLIGCPAQETGAIADRISEGAVQLNQVGDWVLLSVPDA